MAKQFFNHVDFNNHEIRKVILEKLGSPLPAGAVEGRILYSTVDQRPMFFNGTAWQSIGLIQGLIPLVPITIALDPLDNHYIGINPATPVASGSMSAADKTKLDTLTLVDSDDDISHDPIAGGNQIVNATKVFGATNQLDAWSYNHTGSGLPNSNRPHLELKQSDLDPDDTLGGPGGATNDKVASQKAVYNFVTNLVPTIGRVQVPFDVSSATGANDWPLSYDTPLAAGGTTDIMKGDQFIVSIAGNVGLAPVAVLPNDILIAGTDMVADAAATQIDANWTVIHHAALLAATELIAGIAEIATAAETTTGVDDTTIITPLKLQQKYDTITLWKEANNTGAGTTITVTHNFNNRNVQCSAYLNATGEDVECIFTRTNNTVQADVTTAPGAWTVTIFGEDLTP